MEEANPDEDAADEDAAEEDAALSEDVEQEVDQEVDAQQDDPRRASGGSAISGTTAKTSFSQEEAEQLDHEVMIDALPDLATASDKLAQFLVPAGINTKTETWKEVRTTGSKHHKQYNNRIATVNTHKPNFGTQEYIQPRIILRALLGEPSGMETPGPWRPDNIIFKINLSQMLNSLLIICDPIDWTKSAMDALERLDVAFPTAIAGSQFSMEALEFYMQFSVQLTIARLQACIENGDQTPLDSVIESVFLDDHGEPRQAEALGLETIEDDQERGLAYSMLDELSEKLREPFRTEGVDPTAVIGQFKNDYPWDALQQQVVRYYIYRSEYLNRAIGNVGGVQHILKALTGEAERRANSKNYEQGKEKFVEPGSTPRKSLGGGMSLLKKRLSTVTQGAAPVAQMVASSGDDFSGAHDMSGFQAMQRQQAQQIRQSSQRQRPRWTDPQAGAVRISAIDDEGQSSQQPRGKRTHADMEDDFEPTQDEGFQTDMRDHAGADQRRREVAFSSQVRLDPVTGIEMDEDEHVPSPSKRQRLNPGSQIPPPTQPFDEDDENLDPGEMYRRAKTIAKFDRVAASQNKPTRVRQPWTNEEENALLSLVEQHGAEGVSYSALKALDRDSGDERLHRRSAEDLRFKARNMKLTLLK